MLDHLDRRITDLSVSRVKLLHSIAKLTPGYSFAGGYAVENPGFDEAVGTIRFNKRRDGCYTFGMPGKPMMAVWIDLVSGAVVRSGPIDW
jgi:hypothetical protein